MQADEKFMNDALVQAREAGAQGEIPIGAVVVCRGRIIGKGHNMTETLHDATAHAEMIALTAATESLGGKYLTDCTIYVTVEPCPMCAAALNWSQIGRIVYGAPDPKRGYSLYTPSLLHPKTEVTSGVLADECGNLVSDFFRERRKPSGFKTLMSVLLAMLCLCMPVRAQYVSQRDSSYRSDFKAGQLIAPGILMGSGLCLHFFAHDTYDAQVNDMVQDWRGDAPEQTFDNYIQYLPLAMNLTMGLVGAKSEHRFLDRTIETSLSLITLGICSWTMKNAFDTLRPNEANTQSFPSGHTNFAFCGAELVRMEYGWGWGAAAYTVATTVGFMRLYNNWHWASDVIMGAGLGILCAHVGGWLLEPTKRLFGIQDFRGSLSFCPTVDPLTGSFCTSLALSF